MPTLTAQDLPLALLIALLLGLSAWFFIGAEWNVRRGHAALRWLRDGLPILGKRTTMRWMGTTGVRLDLASADAPFKSASLLIMMEPRDVVPLWLLSHLRGRRDTLILRAHLRRHARVEFDIFDAQSWSGRQATADLPEEWTITTITGGLRLAAEGADAAQTARLLMSRLGPAAPAVRRLAVRRTVPHLEVHLYSPWTGSVSSSAILSAVQEIGNLLLPP